MRREMKRRQLKIKQHTHDLTARQLGAAGHVIGSSARSLQKVQGHRTAQGHRAGVDVDVTPPTGGPVGHPPPIRRPCVTAVCREVNRDTQGHLQNTQT